MAGRSPTFKYSILRRPRSVGPEGLEPADRKSTRLNSSHSQISYAVFCLKKKKERYLSLHGLEGRLARHQVEGLSVAYTLATPLHQEPARARTQIVAQFTPNPLAHVTLDH